MNYLHAFGIFTLVESALQNHLFMQNEPNQTQYKAKFKKAEMNVTNLLTMNYER